MWLGSITIFFNLSSLSHYCNHVTRSASVHVYSYFAMSLRLLGRLSSNFFLGPIVISQTLRLHRIHAMHALTSTSQKDDSLPQMSPAAHSNLSVSLPEDDDLQHNENASKEKKLVVIMNNTYNGNSELSIRHNTDNIRWPHKPPLIL